MADLNISAPKGSTIPAVQWIFISIAVLFCTYARISVLLIYPLLVLLFYAGFQWRIDRNAKYLFALMLVCLVLSFRNGLFFMYNLVSLYFFIPFLLLLFAIPPPAGKYNYLKLFMSTLSVVAIVNDVTGFVQYINRPNDDSFSGVYGTFTVSQNGLSLINAVLFFYHLNVFRYTKKASSFGLFLFFLISMVMGFYGAGLLAVIVAIIITFTRITSGNIIRATIFTGVAIAGVMLVMWLISPATLEYNVNIIRIFLDSEGRAIPRKLIVFKNYIQGYFPNIPDLLFGSGPGTFNSRSAFMVGSPDYFNIEFIKSAIQPYYFRNYAYTLWNASNTGPFDGFMNQPFSSLLALLGEYGLLLTAGVIFLALRNFRIYLKAANKYTARNTVQIEFLMFKFTFVLAMLLLVIDNYMEYPEIIALLLLLYKLSQQRLRTALNM